MKEHNQILEKILKGEEAMPNLDKDPLLSKDADLVPTLQGIDGYTLKSQSTFLQGKDRVQVSQGAKNLVSNFIKKIHANDDAKIEELPSLEEQKSEA